MEQNSLFQNDVQKDPLAARLRPASLQDYVGQKHLLGKGKILYNLIEKDMVSSMIFWGPPGVGKRRLPESSPGRHRHILSISVPSQAESVKLRP